jgi:short-subunit dehydrogenase
MVSGAARRSPNAARAVRRRSPPFAGLSLPPVRGRRSGIAAGRNPEDSIMNSTATRPLALVTGASSGIGVDLARELAKAGHDLVLVARTSAPMAALGKELEAQGAAATVLAADLSQAGAAARLVQELASRGLVLDVLVNNAGLGANGRFDESDPVRIGEMLHVNVVALTELTRLVLPGMVARRRGRVLLVASTASFQPGPQMAVYCATKAYVLSLGEAIAYELRGTGVTVTTLCPGATATNFSKVAESEKIALFGSKMSAVMQSAEVARIGVQGLLAGRRVVVTGLLNKLTAMSGRIFPRALILPVTNSLMSKAR